MDHNNKPNFLIVGAAKAGTTSLYEYMRSHPEIFLPKRKEPLYFISESVKFHTKDKYMKQVLKKTETGKTYIDNKQEYLNLFKRVKDEKAIGEASATYLYHYSESIPRIKKELGDVKIIIILRNPVKKAFSQYKVLKKAAAEPFSLSKGIKKEKERIGNSYCSLYHYISQGLYYEQVKAYMENFSQIKIILLEELNKNPEPIMNSVFDFLGVGAPDNLKFTEIHNKIDYVPKFKKLNTTFNTKPLKGFRYKIKSIVPIFYTLLKKYYFKLNSMNTSLSKKDKKLLYGYFKHDIQKLQDYLQRDLSIWMEK